LALARAILADPRILILDEATSSVDAEAGYMIQQALEKVLNGRTEPMIAHRLSTIRNADKIIVLDQGPIVEAGDHRKLVNRRGLYRQLYTRRMELTPVAD
jgi:ABC-type multidrug transport system fused ATPase/permease subunit